VRSGRNATRSVDQHPAPSGEILPSELLGVEILERDRLVLEHDRDGIAYGVDVLPVLPEKAGFDLLVDLLSPAVRNAAGLDLGVDAVDDLALDEHDRLLGLGTAENLEKLRVDHGCKLAQPFVGEKLGKRLARLEPPGGTTESR